MQPSAHDGTTQPADTADTAAAQILYGYNQPPCLCTSPSSCKSNRKCLKLICSRKRGIWTKSFSPERLLASQDPQRRDTRVLPHCGLMNHGNSCYGNSFMQCLFMHLPLREAILQLAPEVMSASSSGAAAATTSSRLLKPQASPASSAESSQPPMSPDQIKLEADVILELSQLFVRMAYGKASFDSPGRVMSLLGWPLRKQQDVHEFGKNVLDFLDGTQQLGRLIKQEFELHTKSHVCCDKCGNTSIRNATDRELFLAIDGQSSVASALDRLFAPEHLTGVNQYQCFVCGSKENATKRFEVDTSRLPPTLVMALLRFPAHGGAEKLDHSISIPMTLHLPSPASADAQPQPGYRLAAIVRHVGSTATSGHYIADVSDPERPGVWWRCDDHRITELRSLHDFKSDSVQQVSNKRKASDELEGPAFVEVDDAQMIDVEVAKDALQDLSLLPPISDPGAEIQSKDAYLLIYKRDTGGVASSPGITAVPSSSSKPQPPESLLSYVQSLEREFDQQVRDYQENLNRLTTAAASRREMVDVFIQMAETVSGVPDAVEDLALVPSSLLASWCNGTALVGKPLPSDGAAKQTQPAVLAAINSVLDELPPDAMAEAQVSTRPNTPIILPEDDDVKQSTVVPVLMGEGSICKATPEAAASAFQAAVGSGMLTNVDMVSTSSSSRGPDNEVASLVPGDVAAAFQAVRCPHGKWNPRLKNEYRYVRASAWAVMAADLQLPVEMADLAPGICIECCQGIRQLNEGVDRVRAVLELHPPVKIDHPSVKTLKTDGLPLFVMSRLWIDRWSGESNDRHIDRIRNDPENTRSNLNFKLVCEHDEPWFGAFTVAQRRAVCVVHSAVWQALCDLYPLRTTHPIVFSPDASYDNCAQCAEEAELRRLCKEANVNPNENLQWPLEVQEDRCHLAHFLDTRTSVSEAVAAGGEWSLIPASWSASLDAFLCGDLASRPAALNMLRDLFCTHGRFRWAGAGAGKIHSLPCEQVLACRPQGWVELQTHEAYCDLEMPLEMFPHGLSLSGSTSAGPCDDCVAAGRVLASASTTACTTDIEILMVEVGVSLHQLQQSMAESFAGIPLEDGRVSHRVTLKAVGLDSTLEHLQTEVQTRFGIAPDMQTWYLGHVQLTTTKRTLGELAFEPKQHVTLVCHFVPCRNNNKRFKRNAAVSAQPEPWECSACTFVNCDAAARMFACSICNEPRC